MLEQLGGGSEEGIEYKYQHPSTIQQGTQQVTIQKRKPNPKTKIQMSLLKTIKLPKPHKAVKSTRNK